MQLNEEDKPYDDINITPMLDLAYVLLVIFIIMTTATVQGQKVNLPKPSSTPSAADEKKPRTIIIANNGTITLDRAPVTLNELESRLRQEMARTPDFPVVVNGEMQAQYQNVIDVLDIVGRLGLTHVGLATKALKPAQ